jgi:hypothetical protein
MPKKPLTLADLELVARRTAPAWWDSLTDEERLALVDRSNQAQAAEENGAKRLDGPPKKARS